MFEVVTKYNVVVDTVEQLPYLLRQTFREATSGTPGPVHLDFLGYEGELIAAAETDMDVIVEEPFTHYPAIRSEPDPESVREATQVLEDAERPVIVAGGGAAMSLAGPDIVELAEMLSIPVATSLNGKGIFPDDHPLSLGVVGSYSRWCANQIVSEADLVLYIGSRTGDWVTNMWTVPQPGTPVIQIDINPSELGRSYPNTVGLNGDAKVTVRKIIEFLSHKASNRQWAQRAQQVVQKWRDEVEPLRKSNTTPILPERLCKEITDVLPMDAVLVVDTGNAAIWSGTMVYLTHPGQRYIRCAGTLGWGFPASLGVKCALPDKPVICFTGDGGLYYHLSELETASRCNIKTVTIINNNQCLRQAARGVNRNYGDKTGNRGEMYKFSKVNFAKIAQEMGCIGIRVERPEEISEALKTALAMDAPVVIDVFTDPEHDAPWTPPVEMMKKS
jgi:acetolactate synthase-1/2/3 large subunit